MTTSYQEQIFFHHILDNHIFLNTTHSEFFVNQNIRELFDIAKDHTLKYKEAPTKDQVIQLVQTKGLGEKLSDDMITSLYNTKQLLSQYDDEWLENNVSAWIQVRNLDIVIRKAIAYMKMTSINESNANQVVENVRHMISSGTAIDFSFNLGADFFNAASHLQTRLARTSSGYDYIDICTKGGYWKGMLMVLFGMPKSGKCVAKDSIIKVRNKKTGKIEEITIEDFHLMIKNSKPKTGK